MLFSGLAAAGCSGPRRADPAPVSEATEADRIAASERPESLVAGASRLLQDNLTAADIGGTFGLPDAKVPYPDTYWSFSYGGTDAQWNPRGQDPRSPLEKYMALTAPDAVDYARSWEYWNHGKGVPGVEDWNGHCPGWAGAALSNAPILHPVLAGPDGAGGIAPCAPGTPWCVQFEIGDINALMAEIYLDGPTSFIGSVCGTPPSAIARDGAGRVLTEGCAGVNPGSLLIAASTLLRRNQIPFAIDAQNPHNTDQIWNQPAYRYHVYDFHPLSATEAANLVAPGTAAGSATGYPWNPAARGFAFVDLALHFVGEDRAHLVLLSGTRSTYEMRMAAVLELDADAADPSASILGGEYLDIPSRGVDRLSVSPFLWVPRGPGPDNLPLSAPGNHHNPYVQPSLVRQLIALGQQ